MSEKINTSGFTIYPECAVVLEVIGVTLQTKKDNPAVKFYRWDFTVRMSDNEDILNEINQCPLENIDPGYPFRPSC